MAHDVIHRKAVLREQCIELCEYLATLLRHACREVRSGYALYEEHLATLRNAVAHALVLAKAYRLIAIERIYLHGEAARRQQTLRYERHGHTSPELSIDDRLYLAEQVVILHLLARSAYHNAANPVGRHRSEHLAERGSTRHIDSR